MDTIAACTFEDRQVFDSRKALADYFSHSVGPDQSKEEIEESNIKRFPGIDPGELFHPGETTLVMTEEINIEPTLDVINAFLKVEAKQRYLSTYSDRPNSISPNGIGCFNANEQYYS